MGDETETGTIATEIRVGPGHPVMVQRDHHILTYLREVSKLTGGSVGFPVAAIDRLWLDAYELGIEHGAAIADAARPKRKAK